MRNVMIVGYPRSGNTFLGYLLSYYFNAPYYDMYDYPRIVSGQYTLEEMLLSPEAFSGSFERPDQEKQVNAVLKSHELPQNLHSTHKTTLDHLGYKESDPLILITREPKDVAVSYFYYSFFRVRHKKGHWSSFLPYPLRRWYYLQFHFRSFALRVAGEWSEFVNSWIELSPFVIRYEDLLGDPLDHIRLVCDRFGFSFQSRYASEATEFCQFSNVVKLEESNPAYAAKAQHRSERFVRAGKVGQGEALLSPQLQQRFDTITQEAAQLVGCER
ncbi:MAG: sulfotransferase domain-containing protein [bacterium]